MKHICSCIMRFCKLYFTIFGIVQSMFLVRNFIPPFGLGGKIVIHHSIVSLVTALVFTIAHMVIFSESLDSKISVKSRMIICSIPCAVVCGYLAFNFGLQSWLRYSTEQTTAIVIWVISFAVSLIAFLLIYILIEMRYLAVGKKYDEALAAYKRKNGGVQIETDRNEGTEKL